MKLLGLLVGIAILSTVDSQQCRAQLNQNITGQCSSISNCNGTLLAGNSCEGPRCCIPTREFSSVPCNTADLFNALYNTTRGKFLRQVFDFGFSSANICGNCQAKAAFLAIAATMTNNFQTDELIKTDAQFAADDKKYGNNATGDGSRFRRRGFFGLRGRTIYQRLQTRYPQYQSFANPESVALVESSIQIAAQLWKTPDLLSGESLTKYADGSFFGFSMIWYKLSGDIAQLPEAVLYYAKFLRQMKCGGDLYPGEGQSCRFNATHNGTCVPNCLKGMEEVGSACGCSGPTVSTCQNGPQHIVCCLDSCSQDLKMDLGFVLDASGSINPTDYQIQLNFTKDLLIRANVGVNKTHVGIINYSIDVDILTWLNTDYSLNEKLRKVDSASHYAQATYTDLALQEASRVFSYANGRRTEAEGVTPVIFVITDGASNGPSNATVAAQTLKDKGIILVSVGVGSGPNIPELHAMCTPPASENYFAISDYAALNQKLNQFTSKSCSEPAPVESNSTVTVDLGKDKYKFLKIEIAQMGNKILINITLFNGSVNLFYSFTNRNPKDPNEFIDYETRSTESLKSNIQETLERFVHRNEPKSNEITLVIDKPQSGAEFVYVGIKGIEENNKFEVKLDDCANVDCILYSNASTARRSFLSMILVFGFLIGHNFY